MTVSCWASARGGCSDVQSKEHYVSEGLFEDASVTVSGFAWCKSPKTIPLASASSKILCEYHNNKLSPLDASASRAFSIFREIDQLESRREQILGPRGNRIWNIVERTIEGASLERWFLKTTANLVAMIGAPLNWGGSSDSMSPPVALLDLIYGAAPICPPHGVYFAVNAGQKIKKGDEVGFVPLYRSETNEVCGGLFEFWGLRLVLWLADDPPPPRSADFLSATGLEGWADSGLNHRMTTIRYKNGRYLSQRLLFNWSR